MTVACHTRPAPADHDALFEVRDPTGVLLCHATPEQVELALSTGHAFMDGGTLRLLAGARRGDDHLESERSGVRTRAGEFGTTNVTSII